MNELNLILSIFLFANVTASSVTYEEIQDQITEGVLVSTEENPNYVVIVSSDDSKKTEKTISPEDEPSD